MEMVQETRTTAINTGTTTSNSPNLNDEKNDKKTCKLASWWSACKEDHSGNSPSTSTVPDDSGLYPCLATIDNSEYQIQPSPATQNNPGSPVASTPQKSAGGFLSAVTGVLGVLGLWP